MSTTKKTYNENAIREAAYYCWQNAGCPYGKDEYFWNMAVKQLYGSSSKSSSCSSSKRCSSKSKTSCSSSSSCKTSTSTSSSKKTSSSTSKK